MPYPPVTVLIPAYNAKRTIGRALASVWHQNYPDMEVVVVDDGSSDGTGSEIHQMHRGNLRLFRLEKNRGECGAMNAGIEQARADYIAFLDADDEWLDDKLLTQIPILESHPGMSLVACGGESVNAEGEVFDTFGLETSAYSPHEFWRGLLVKSYIVKPTVVARRAKLLEVGGFDETLKISGDQDMWIRLALAGEVGFVPQVLVRVHDTPDSLMKRYGVREDKFLLPMIREHLSRLTSRLSRREIRQILGHRYAGTGRNLYRRRPGRGAALIFRGMLLGNRPLQNLTYLIWAAPPVARIKMYLRSRGRSNGENPDKGRETKS